MRSVREHRFITAAAFLAAVICVPLITHAESVDSFDAMLAVQQDGTVLVTEQIAYDFADQAHHGIFRDIPLSYADEAGRSHGVELSHVTATMDGASVPLSITTEGDTERIKIGDPNREISGSHRYSIEYAVRGAVMPLTDATEVYWNATGNGWTVDIQSSTAVISFPNSLPIVAASCYVGASGSTAPCSTMATTTGSARFAAGRILAPGEGLTVAAAVPQGLIETPSVAVSGSHFPESLVLVPGNFVIDALRRFFASTSPIVVNAIFAVIALGIVAYAYRMWQRHGDDPRGRGTIIPEYDAPKGMTPLEASRLFRDSFRSRDITAGVIWLAVRGALAIERTESKTLGIFKDVEYRLIERDGVSSLTTDSDRELFTTLFSGATVTDGVRSIRLKDIDKREASRSRTAISRAARAELVAAGLYDDASTSYQNLFIFLAIFFAIAGFVLALLSIDFDLPASEWIGLLGSLLVAELALALAAIYMSRLTQEGVYAKEALLGLKEYLQIAEKDRLAFHNAPEKNPQRFEALLPYAILFGVEKAWAKEFEGVLTEPPSWYAGNPGTFSTIYFANELHAFSMSISAATALSSSGAGGGGFAGGGAGGGGGGSW